MPKQEVFPLPRHLGFLRAVNRRRGGNGEEKEIRIQAVCGYFQEVQPRQKLRHGIRLIHQTLLTSDAVKLPHPLGHMTHRTAFRSMGTFLQERAGLRHTRTTILSRSILQLLFVYFRFSRLHLASFVNT